MTGERIQRLSISEETIGLMPNSLMHKLVYDKDGILDGSRSFAILAAEGRKHLVSFAVYTAELELDVVKAAFDFDQRDKNAMDTKDEIMALFR